MKKIGFSDTQLSGKPEPAGKKDDHAADFKHPVQMKQHFVRTDKYAERKRNHAKQKRRHINCVNKSLFVPAVFYHTKGKSPKPR